MQLDLQYAPHGARACAWCSGPVSPRARADAIYCRKACRQAAHRAKVQRPELSRVAGAAARLAYADPPYIGLSRRYYGSHPDYAGEVDHEALLDRLATYDGWALSCSSASVPFLLAACLQRELVVDLAVWVRRPAPHPTAGLVTAFEGVIVHRARSLARSSTQPLHDVLTDHTSPRQRSTLPSSVKGMKPPGFLAWVFALMGAQPGDELDDLFPGSGMVGRVWREWSRPALQLLDGTLK